MEILPFYSAKFFDGSRIYHTNFFDSCALTRFLYWYFLKVPKVNSTFTIFEPVSFIEKIRPK